MSLKEYNKKRNFKKSPEPVATNLEGENKLQFVVQRHSATTLHYDLRLEMDGVLKSWAVPKGPSMNPSDKRLAMETEDHPYEYKDFEGTIPEGNYGAGEMEIWDLGWYQYKNIDDKAQSEKKLLSGYHKGSFKFTLHGEKLKGAFALVKLEDKQKNAWLLTKIDDEYATSEHYNSEDYISENSKISTKKEDKGIHVIGYGNPSVLAELPEEAIKQKMPDTVSPMLAKLIDAPFNDPKWIFEIKWDGYRAVATVKGGKAVLRSRNGLVFDKYTPINKDLAELEYDAILDGEIVVLSDEGKADFQKLQRYGPRYADRLYFQVFDLLYFNGYNMMKVPLLQRMAMLKQLVFNLKKTKFNDYIQSRGKDFYKAAEQHELEGIIGKRADSLYHPGKRSSDWVKIKVQKRQEAVIGGFTEPKGGRQYFGSLILGVYEGDKLKYIGSSGGGFKQKQLQEIYQKLEERIIPKSPFSEKIAGSGKMTWVKPELICEVAFSEWTKDNNMRHPVFLGLRSDKDPKDVIKEEPEPAEEVKEESEELAEKEHRKENPATRKSKQKSVQNVGPDSKEFEIDDRIIVVNNWNKIYWPESEFTKGDMVEYYMAIAPYILPYLKDRPESLHRHPNGIKGDSFYQKDMGDLTPAWIPTYTVERESTEGTIKYMLCQDKATLIYMANLGCIEINPWSSRVQKPDHPDWIVMDIDPAENTFEEVIEVAQAVKEVLDKAGAEGYPKTSGSSGMHIYIPLGAKYTYDQGKNFANIIAMEAHRKLPKLTSIERMTRKRKDKIYLDYLQNIKGQTLAAPYSVRPKPGATVSAPLEWKEVKSGLHPSQFTIKNMPVRVKKKGDLFKGVLGKGIDMLQCIELLEQ